MGLEFEFCASIGAYVILFIGDTLTARASLLGADNLQTKDFVCSLLIPFGLATVVFKCNSLGVCVFCSRFSLLINIFF